MVTDALLTEIERQKKYLAELPEDFAFPLFNVRHAVESQRNSGYRDTAAATRELIDNSIEAGASRVDVVFNSSREVGGTLVNALAVIDNGSGMLPQMARYALSWGGGTHFEDNHFIGRFGYGLPNASLNQTRCVEVYTRVEGASAWSRAVLDITEVNKFGLQTVREPDTARLPGFVADYLKRSKTDLPHGTVVVWQKPDRLTYRRAANLKEHLVDDFAVVYRYLLKTPAAAEGRFQLVVEGVQVQPTDPLFLMPEARLFLSVEEGGASLVEDRLLPVRLEWDDKLDERRLRLIRPQDEMSDEDVLGTIRVRVVRFPVGFAEEKGSLPDSQRRFDIRKRHRGMSFVRAGREIETVDVFPRSQRDIASGLGKWPLLQSYAYHWGIEIQFRPELDDVFGITNDKQAVRPVEDFWRVLAEASVDESARRENRWQERERRRPAPIAESPDPTPAELAASGADVATGTARRVPQGQVHDAREGLDRESEDRAKGSTETPDEIKKAIEAEAKRRPYAVHFVESEHGPFFEPQWVGTQSVVNVNRAHPFYRLTYGELANLEGSARVKQALDLLLISLGRAELAAEDELLAFYRAQRKEVWSPFLEHALMGLEDRMRTPEEA